MELNLKYYKGTDNYSDGDIEDKILSFIKKYPNNYEEAFNEDSSWAVFYHLSNIRKNAISWYPFEKDASILEVGGGMGALTEELCKKCKKVTSIELSKKRASAILERNKNAKNLEIYVGNFEDIQLEEKYDYILLNGVLEYGALYISSDNPYEEFINKLKKNLKKSGKILIAIENRFGLKYWCGASEDHTGIPFDGINGYRQNKDIKTFNKNELECLAKQCGMNINFYYMFPDYKFPKVIYTDSSLQKNIFSNYNPYYCAKMNMVLDENRLYKDVFNNGTIPFFANSYFLELSENIEELKVEFVKFNNDYRKNKYNICTFLKNNKFYKKAISQEAVSMIQDIKKVDQLLDLQDVNHAKVIESGNEIYTENIDGENLFNILDYYYKMHNMDEVHKIYDRLYQLIKKGSGKKIKYTEKNIFDKYGIKLKSKELQNMNFYEYGFIDMFPNNIIVCNNDYILIDQEWFEENVPIEYTMYRAILNFFYLFDDGDKYAQLFFKKYNIKPSIFEKLDKKFLEEVRGESYKIFQNHYIDVNFISNLTVLEYTKTKLEDENNVMLEENKNLVVKVKNLDAEVENINHKLNSIYNSKGYRILNKFYMTKGKFFKIKNK